MLSVTGGVPPKVTLRDHQPLSEQAPPVIDGVKAQVMRAFSDRVELGGIEPSRALRHHPCSVAIAAGQGTFSNVLQ